MRAETGFSLIEVLSTIALMSVLMTLGAFALRQYWFQRALYGEQDEIVTQLRSMQEKVTAESNPLVYGARFIKNSPSWRIVQYDPNRTPAGTECRTLRTISMDGGVEIKRSRFEEVSPATVCDDQLGGRPRDYVFFFSRGTSTSGGVTITQTNLDGRRLSLCVNGITGRVTKFDGNTTCSGEDDE